MSLTGHVQNGVVVFDAPNALPDGTAVKVEAIEAPPKPTQRSLLDRLGDVVGKVEGLPADASPHVESPSSTLRDLADLVGKFPANSDWPADGAAQVDHYLYGTPKKP